MSNRSSEWFDDATITEAARVMRALLPLLTLAIVVGVLVSPAGAQETVTFPQYRPASEGSPVVLKGTLYKPSGDGPFRAIVLLHGCAGVDNNDAQWGGLLKNSGYVVLSVDSFGPRGIKNNCMSFHAKIVERSRDAYGGLAYLSRLPFVDPKRIGTMGFSNGGAASLFSVLSDTAKLYPENYPKFRVAAPFYPVCWDFSPTGYFVQDRPISVPILILIGERDLLTPAHVCQILIDQARARGERAFIKVYPQARHSFDSGNAEARNRALVDLLAFLKEYL